MFLKKLQLLGFKSFADKTEFSFDGGITAFVGPNGCGKSNVVDAVRWILGEQSAKSLRGNEMLDVIFNGSGGRSSLGYAEASLTFSNAQKRLPTEFEEVCVTRRLFRSGESEYLINNQPCRLKDIRELFLDTGVGTDSYWVIEQGRVDALIQANPQERRVVFEEAAGISKYKAKKKEAMARLERVEQDLLRLNDIMAEVQSQLRSIKIQATRARNFQEYKAKLREMRTALAVHEFRRLKGDLTATTKQAEEKTEQAKGLAAQLNTLDAQTATLNTELGGLDEELAKVMTNCATLKGQMESAQSKISMNRERTSELDGAARKLLSQIQEAQRKIEELREYLALSKADIAKLDLDLQGVVENVRAKREDVERTKQACSSLTNDIETKKGQVIDKLQKIAGVQNQLSTLGTEKLQHTSRRERLGARQREIATAYETISQEEQEVRTQTDNLTAALASLTQRLTEGRVKAAQLAREGEEIGRDIEQLKQLRARKESRREVLLDLELRAEDVEVGVKTVIEEGTKANAPFGGVKGMVANLVKVSFEHALAIEASLAEQAQSVVTETTASAAAAVEFLRNHQRGRAAFLALDRVRGGATPPATLLSECGVVGRASDLVRYEPPLHALVDHLLGGTIVVQDFQTALKIGCNGGSGFRLVTLTGEVIEPGGAIRGGRQEGHTGLISRKSELESLEAELREIAKKVEHQEWRRQTLSREIGQLDQEEAELSQQIKEGVKQRSDRELHLDMLARDRKKLQEEEAVNQSEVNDIDGSLADIARKEDPLRQEMAGLATERKSIEDEVRSTADLLRQREADRDRLFGQLTALQIEEAMKREKKGSLERAAQTCADELRDREAQLANMQEDLAACRKRHTDVLQEIGRNELLVTDLAVSQTLADQTAKSLEGQRMIARAALQCKLGLAREVKNQQEALAGELQKLLMLENKLKLQMDGMADRMREEYEVRITEADAQGPPEDASVNWDQVKAEAEAIRNKIERMGNVNLDAIQEQDQLEIRLAEYTKQTEDISKAQRDLQEVIRKINQTSRELFEKTFNDVRTNFQEIYRKLFGGGKADIVLEEGVDILEAGIDIVARPPGKELRSITLLSGGEKTMTTVALLFAIFKARPSPFCILDEVDAALDENNISRFVLMLNDFIQDCQFLIITHSKRTMSVADVLYGITMQESGVSKKVSVRFHEIERKVA